MAMRLMSSSACVCLFALTIAMAKNFSKWKRFPGKLENCAFLPFPYTEAPSEWNVGDRLAVHGACALI